MAASAKPFGLRPINLLGGQANSGSIRLYKIASGYATGIFYGDLVSMLASSGTIQKETGTTTATPVGVFLGVEYMSALQGLLQRNQWTASTTVPTGTTAWAYVCDDPDMLFEIQANGSLSQNCLGTNAAIVQGAGSTSTGMSGVTLNAGSIATTATLPLRIVDWVKRPDNALGDAFTNVIVRLNTHFNRTALGIAP
jgi:hypothetical protein